MLLDERAVAAFLAILASAGTAFAADARVTRKASLEGDFSYEVRSDGSAAPAYVQTSLPARQRSARFSWLSRGKRVRFLAGAPQGTRVVVARVVSGTRALESQKACWEVALIKKAGSEQPVLTLRIYEQGRASTDFDLGLANRRASIDLYWMGASSSRSNDGAVLAIRNGRVRVVATNLDNRSRLGAFAIGMLSNPQWIEKKRSVLFDSVEITRL